MGKTKSERKQEKKASMQEAKSKEQEKQQVKEEVIEKKIATENEAKTTVKATPGPEQVTLTMYTLIAMIVTFVSAGVAALAMAIYGKPVDYLIKTYIGDALNDYSQIMLKLYLIDDLGEAKMMGLYLAVAILVGIGAIATLIGMIRAVNEFNKPMIVLNVIGIIMAATALVVFMYADNYIKDGIHVYDIPDRQPVFGIYNLYLPALIVNIVVMVCNLLASLHGLKRWSKTGRTSK